MIAKRLIKTRQEDSFPLLRIEKLMDARPGTAEGDELEFLTRWSKSTKTSTLPFRRRTLSRRFGFAWNRRASNHKTWFLF